MRYSASRKRADSPAKATVVNDSGAGMWLTDCHLQRTVMSSAFGSRCVGERRAGDLIQTAENHL
jgi:hypothetical protein